MIKAILKKAFKMLLPNLYWKVQFTRLKKNFAEAEMHLLSFLCHKEKISLDIGAAGGVFIINMVDHSRKVIAFEPIPVNVDELRTIVGYLNKNVEIMPVALSDSNGESTLRMVDNDLGRSTIEEENILEDGIESNKSNISVTTKKLDSFNYPDVGFIKIDVEGHELSVLQGAEKTIEKYQPSLLIEIEERHKNNSIQNVADFLKKFGYQGLFILDNKLTDLEKFDVKEHQDPKNIGDVTDHYKRKGTYINNFIFLQKEKIAAFKQSSKAKLEAI